MPTPEEVIPESARPRRRPAPLFFLALTVALATPAPTRMAGGRAPVSDPAGAAERHLPLHAVRRAVDPSEGA
jgi:hypothetical protein